MIYPHPPQLMAGDEVDAWLAFFERLRIDGANLDGKLHVEAWKVEGMISTIDQLRNASSVELGR